MTITRLFGPAHSNNTGATTHLLNFMQQAAINEAAARGGAITLILRGADRMLNWERYLPGVPRLTPSQWCERARDAANDIIVVDDLPLEMRSYLDKTLEAVEAEVWIYEGKPAGPRPEDISEAFFRRYYGNPFRR
jgi:hypothetical protein